MPKTLNKVLLIGNVTRDPELRKTEAGTSVCSFGLATNRTGKTETGEKTEEVDYHRIVAWQKLADMCNEYLRKGRKVYIEGRLTTRSWTGQDGQPKTTTEVVLDDIILLDSKQPSAAEPEASDGQISNAVVTA
ncbi:MAG TPA: single-stranded DNA-binding protein [Gammaproteobacteria bacterium]|nr:single-stranded DNA-binding protein [Gammaproteobacteria bacterium]